jgi:hypothetical protein
MDHLQKARSKFWAGTFLRKVRSKFLKPKKPKSRKKHHFFNLFQLNTANLNLETSP